MNDADRYDALHDADRYDALQDAGREPPSTCQLCGRGTEGTYAGPCSSACEREDYIRRRSADMADHMESWGCREDADDEEEVPE